MFSVEISWCSLHHDIPTENTVILYHPCIDRQYPYTVFSVWISWCSIHHDIPTENTIIVYHPCIDRQYPYTVFSVGISWCSLHHDIPTENTIILYHPYEGSNSNIYRDIDGQCRDIWSDIVSFPMVFQV